MSGGLYLCVTMSLLCQQAGNLIYKIYLKWKLCSSSSVCQFFTRQSPLFSESGLIYKLLTNYPCIMDIGQTEHKSLGRDRKGLRIWLEKGSCWRMIAITTTNLPLFLWTSSFWSFWGNTRHVDVYIKHTYVQTDIQGQTQNRLTDLSVLDLWKGRLCHKVNIRT